MSKLKKVSNQKRGFLNLVFQNLGVLITAVALISMGISYAWEPSPAQGTPAEGNVTLDSGGVTQEWVENYVAANASMPSGYLQRANFTYYDADEITLGPATYEINGKIVNWESAMNYQLTSLAANTWYYIYLDDSEISASGTIDNTKLTHSSTAPTLSGSKHGWYSGDDRCIFAVRSNGSAQVTSFFMEDELILFAASINIINLWLPGSAFVDAPAFILPSVSQKALATFKMRSGSDSCASVNTWWRVNGDTSSGHWISEAHETDTKQTNAQLQIITDVSKRIEVRSQSTSCGYVTIYQDGWYLPLGM